MQIFATAFFGLHISPQFPSLAHMIANLFQPINSFLLASKELCNSKIQVPVMGGKEEIIIIILYLFGNSRLLRSVLYIWLTRQIKTIIPPPRNLQAQRDTFKLWITFLSGMALPTVLTGSTYCWGGKAKGKHISPFLHPGLQLPVHSRCHGSAAGPLPFLCCVLSTKVPHLHPPQPVPVGLSCLVRGREALP